VLLDLTITLNLTIFSLPPKNIVKSRIDLLYNLSDGYEVGTLILFVCTQTAVFAPPFDFKFLSLTLTSSFPRSEDKGEGKPRKLPSPRPRRRRRPWRPPLLMLL